MPPCMKISLYSPDLQAFLKVICLTQILPKAYGTNNSIIDNNFCISIFRSAQQSDILRYSPSEEWKSACK